jgi:hypothetical protein
MRASFLVRRPDLDEKNSLSLECIKQKKSLKRPEGRKYKFDFYKKEETLLTS